MESRDIAALAGSIGLSFTKPVVRAYSFKDLTGSISHPAVGAYLFSGKGVGQITVKMEGSLTYHEVDVYGNVLVGDYSHRRDGKLSIVCQQTSDLHMWLMYLYTHIMANRDQKKDAGGWAKLQVLLRNEVLGVTQTFRGMSLDNVPELTYAAQGQMLSWVLWAARIDTVVSNPSRFVSQTG